MVRPRARGKPPFVTFVFRNVLVSDAPFWHFPAVARKTMASSPSNSQQWSLSKRKIRLTPARTLPGQDPVKLAIHLTLGQLIAYSQDYNFTRLNLTGGKVLEVRETTAEIDRLVRAAAAQSDLPLRKPAPRRSPRAR